MRPVLVGSSNQAPFYPPLFLLIFPSFVLDFPTVDLSRAILLSRYFLCPIEGFTTTAAAGAEEERGEERPFQLFHETFSTG